MRERKGHVRNAHVCSNFGGSSMKPEGRLSTALTHHFDLEPVHPSADSRPQGLCTRLFGGKARSQALGGFPFAQAIGLFGRGKNAVEKPLPKALHGIVYTPYLNQIDAAAHDHAGYQTKPCIP